MRSGSLPALRVLFILAVAGPVAATEDAALPAEECVRLLRAARIAGLREGPAAELGKLEQARAACPDEIGPLDALVAYYRRQPQEWERYRQFLGELVGRLQNPEYDLPAGIIEYLIRNPDVEADQLSAILDNVSRQVERAGEPDPGLMRIRAELEQRLGRIEAAAATLEWLLRETGADDLVWALVHIYFELERWQDAAELIAPQLEQKSHLRTFYIHVLGKLGRYKELLEQIEILASDPSLRRPVAHGEPAQAAGADADLPGHVVDVVLRLGLIELLKQVAWDLRDQGQEAQAETIFRGLLAHAPDDTALRATVLHLYASEQERRGYAETLADKWQTETDPNLLFEEGTQRLTAGDAAGAIELLRRAAPEFPNLEAVWYNLGMAAYRLEDWATVDSAFGRAGELNPERAQTFFFRGLALEKLGRCGEAVDALGRAVELDPERALAHYYLAACHRKLGNAAAAAAARSRYEATKN